MKIDKRLNLVFPVETARGEITVHSEPIQALTFKRYFLEISKTFAAIHNEALGITAAPRVAKLMLERVAAEGSQDGGAGVTVGLLPEIRRLTNVVMPGGGETVPWQEVVDGKLIDEDDIEEVENAIVFFIVASAMYPKSDRRTMLTGATRLWGGRVESLSFTELAASLRTSTAPASSGEKAKASSIPS